MVKEKRSAIIISASSDIGTSISLRWLSLGWKVFGTYRTKSKTVDELKSAGATLSYCDLSDSKSTHDACFNLRTVCSQWDILVMCPGRLEPIGAFVDCSFTEWEESIKVNFTGQMHILHELLPFRQKNTELGPIVFLFAGGGTNSSPVNYSAYVISKIAQIKICELFDAEIPDTRFVIIGPGWVKTKIHNSTLRAGAKAGNNYQRTMEMLSNNECTPMNGVLDCIDWLIEKPRELISGRNFSVVFDQWKTKELEDKLSHEPDMYKLRRYGNEWLVKDEK